MTTRATRSESPETAMMAIKTYWPEEAFADLDRTGPVPLYSQIASRLEAAIHAGTLPPGARLENEIAIGARLNLSRPTVRRAIQDLVDKGMLVRRRGVGTQVVHGAVTRAVELTSLHEDLRKTGHCPTTRVLDHRVVPAPTHVAEHLGVTPGAEVLWVRRQRDADGSPVAVMVNYLPPELQTITATQLATRGLYDILRSRGITIRVAKQTIGARRSDDAEADVLRIERGDPVLTMSRIAYDSSGRAIEFGDHCYRPDRYRFETTLVAK